MDIYYFYNFKEKHSRKATKSGFTLIELSIVLVIIGLIVGGMLVGKDLIQAAAIRAQISDQKYNTAANTLKLKYNCLPGDCQGATNFLISIGCGNVLNGDDDKIIRTQIANYQMRMDGESAGFFTHLSIAGLLENAGRLSYCNAGVVQNIAENITSTRFGKTGVIILCFQRMVII